MHPINQGKKYTKTMPNTFGDMAIQYMWHMPYQTFMFKNKKKYNRFNQKTKKINNF